MNPWIIMSIFERLGSMKSVMRESLNILTESANKETPNDEWVHLNNWDTDDSIKDLESWLLKIFLEDLNGDIKAVYFLLFDTELNSGEYIQDLYVHISNDFHDSKSYELWPHFESEKRSCIKVFEDIRQIVKRYMNIDGYADYSIPLFYSGVAVFSAMQNLSKSGKLSGIESIGFGVGYRYGDAFNLGKIVNGELVSAFERLM